jgi:hypothetical protein
MNDGSYKRAMGEDVAVGDVSFARAIDILARRQLGVRPEEGEPGYVAALRRQTDGAVATLERASCPGEWDRSWINMAPTVSGMPGVHVASRIGMCELLR